MWTWDYNIYLGDNSDVEHVGVATSESFFVVAQGRDLDESTFHEGLENLKQHVLNSSPKNLSSFMASVDEGLGSFSASLVSCAAALVVENVIYLMTKGEGEVFVARQKKVAQLIAGDTSSSGFVEKDDYFVLTNRAFSKGVSDKKLEKLLLEHSPQEVVETLAPELKPTNDIGMCALFMKADKSLKIASAGDVYETVEDTEEDIDQASEAVVAGGGGVAAGVDMEDAGEEGAIDVLEMEDPGGLNDDTDIASTSPSPLSYDRFVPQTQPGHSGTPLPSQQKRALGSSFALPQVFKRFTMGTAVSKKVTLVIAAVLIAVLGWSVISGNARRERQQFIEKVAAEAQAVDGKLSEAQELAGLNTQKSLELIEEANVIVSTLQQEAAEKKLADIQELADLQIKVQAVEDSIKKEENGQAEEFYDLDLIKKGTEVAALYSDGETLTMLNPSERKVHLLDLAEKSVDTISLKKADKTELVSMRQKEPYMFGSSVGVVKYSRDDEEEELVPADSDWGSIKDFWMYSGNMYLLDSGKNDVHKYVVGEEGYSSKRSYFGSGLTLNLQDATAMAIDSSVYIAAGERVLKYTSGAPDSFSVSIPDEDEITFEDIYTDADTDSVYLLDKDSQRIFVTSKSGEFEKQMSIGIIRSAQDFVVVPDIGILILSGGKIYSVGL